MNKLKRNFYPYYIAPILRAFKLKYLLVVFFYKKIALFLFVRGIRLPGIDSIRDKLNKDFSQKIEREKLIYDIKANRFQFRLGPLWFRYFVDKCNVVYQKNKFLFLILRKTSISIVCIFIPVYTFILLRGVLPVPDRVPYQKITVKHDRQVNSHIDYPYEKMTSDVDLTTQPKQFIIGFPSFKLNVLNGYTVSENTPLPLKDIYPESNHFLNSNIKLNLDYYLYPANSGKPISCVLQVFNDTNELLAQNTVMTPIIESTSEYSIRNSWRRAFTPNIIPSYGHIHNFSIALNEFPRKLIIKTLSVGNRNDVASDDLDRCSAIISDLSVSHESKTPLPRRGMIFIVVDGLQTNVAYSSRFMPKINKFMNMNSFQFQQHFAQSQEKNFSIQSLFTSRYPLEFKNNKNLVTFPEELKRLGYKVGAIGAASQELGIQNDEINLGFSEGLITENARYNGRYVTEMSGQWLAQYAKDPFFLYVHYNALRPPYKPPFEYLDLLKLILHPFGADQKEQLYRGVARYFDDELELLFQKLGDLDLINDVDIVLTSDFGNLPDNLENHTSYMQFKVPLWIKLSSSKQDNLKIITEPSAHLDLFPTVYKYMGGDLNTISARGVDFSDIFFNENKTNSLQKLKNRSYLFFDSEESFGVIALNSREKPEVYERKLYKIGENTQIREYSSVPLLKKIYFKNNLSDKILHFTSQYEGNIKIDLELAAKNQEEFKTFFLNEIPEIIDFPKNIQISVNSENNIFHINIRGIIQKSDSISLNIKHLDILKFNFHQTAEPVMCEEGMRFKEEALIKALRNNICPFLPVRKENLYEIEKEIMHPILIQLFYKNEYQELIK